MLYSQFVLLTLLDFFQYYISRGSCRFSSRASIHRKNLLFFGIIEISNQRIYKLVMNLRIRIFVKDSYIR